MIPPTNPRRYLSGITGLNIPCPDRTFGDWHFTGVFRPAQESFDLAGEGEGTIANTNPWLVQDGVHECGEVLRSHGIKVQGEVYAASHSRSLLDKVVSLSLQGSEVIWIAQSLVANDYLPGHQIRFLDQLIARCDPSMPGFEALTKWRFETHHWSPLEDAVGKSQVAFFTHQGAEDLDESQQVHFYQHAETGRHLTIGDNGKCYQSASSSYREIPHEAALAHVLSNPG